MRSPTFHVLALTFLALTPLAESAAAQEPGEVATPTSIYTVEATYSAGGSDWVRVRIYLEFAHVSGATFYSAQGWGPQEGERRWSVVPAVTSTPATQNFPEAVIAQPGNLLYYFGGGVARADDEDAIDDLYNQLAVDFQYNTYPWQVYGQLPDDFRTWVSFEPDTVTVGETFQAKLEFDNYIGIGPDLMDITPKGPLSMSSEDGGEASMESGPTPESVSSLPYSGRSSFTYMMTADAPGTVRMEGMLEAAWDYFYPDMIQSTSVCGEFESTPCMVVIEESGLIVNDTGDGADVDPGDGICDGDADTDGSQCTLRAVLEEAEAMGGEAEILFDLEGAGPFLISPESALPVIGDGITLDATSQPGWTDAPIVRIDGSNAGGAVAGLVIDGDDVAIRGFMITGFGSHGVHVVGGSGLMLETLIVGSNASGAAGMGNGGDGIHISGGTDMTIGSEAGAGKTGGAAINIGSVISMGNLLNGLYAVNESNVPLIRSDIRAVEVREGAAAKGGGASSAININLSVNNLIVGALGLPQSTVARPNGLNGVCLRGISDAFLNRVHVSDATMNAVEIIASQRIAIRRLIAGMRVASPQALDQIGSIGESILKVFESADITVGSESASDEPVEGVAAGGWFMDVQDSERVDVANIMAGLTANMQALPSSMWASMRNLAGGILFRNTPFATVGRTGVPTILANNGGNSSMPQAGLMATGPLMESFRALNLHIGTTPSGLAGIGNLGSGLVLADGIREALLGGENPFERIVSAGNMGYGYLFRDIAPQTPAKGGAIVNIVSGTRLISDMVPKENGDLAALSNAFSGFCMLRAQGVMMNMFSVGPSGRHGIEAIDSSDLQFLAGSIGSLFERPITVPGDLMGPARNGFSLEGGRRISIGGLFGGFGGPVSEIMSVLINNTGESGVSADAVELLEMVSTGVGQPPPDTELSAAVLAKMGSAFEAIRIRNTVGAVLRGLQLHGNGLASPNGAGAVFVELSRDIKLIQSQLGQLLANGQPGRPNAFSAVKSVLNDSLLLELNQVVGHLKGVEAENSSVTLKSNRMEMQGVLGGVGRAVEQIGGSIEALRNNFSQNTGPALVLQEMQSALIRFNNIAGNAIGILAEGSGGGNTPPVAGKSGTPGAILAPDNWWGDPSGPGGEGPGSGDAISAGVTVDSWLTSANGIIIAPGVNVVEAAPGATVVIPTTFATPLFDQDEIDVTVTDERGWVTSSTSFSVDVTGSAGTTRDIELLIGEAGVNRVTIHARSTTDPTLEGEVAVIAAPPGAMLPLGTAASAGTNVLDTAAEGLLALGGEILINPGGANEETATVAGFGSIILESPLRFNHSAGEIVIPANRMAVGREDAPGGTAPVVWGLDAYPNPARQRLSMALDAPVSSTGRIELFDLLGRRQAVPLDGAVRRGRHVYDMDVSRLAPGVYLARGRFGERTMTVLVTVVQ